MATLLEDVGAIRLQKLRRDCLRCAEYYVQEIEALEEKINNVKIKLVELQRIEIEGDFKSYTKIYRPKWQSGLRTGTLSVEEES